jgi:hypothetical protein
MPVGFVRKLAFTSLSNVETEPTIGPVGMGVMLATIWIKLGDEASTVNDRLSVHFYSVAFLAFSKFYFGVEYRYRPHYWSHVHVLVSVAGIPGCESEPELGTCTGS